MKNSIWRDSLLLLMTSFVLISAVACATQRTPDQPTKNSPFTHGNVQLNLKNGVTTQAEVLSIFGAPNVATTDGSGNEVWTYQKNATVSKRTDSSGYATVILLGGTSSTSGFEQSSRTMTLIIKFGQDKRVIDFDSMTTSF